MANPFVDFLSKMSFSQPQNNQPQLQMQMPVNRQIQVPQVQQPMQQQAAQRQPSLTDYFTPESSAQNAFMQQFNQFPQAQQPSGWRRFGAALGAMNSENPFLAAQQMAYPQYFQDLQNWKMKMPYYQQAADNERQSNISARQTAQYQMTNDLARRKQDEVERAAGERETLNRTKESRQQQLAQLQAWKAQNPLINKTQVDAEGNVFAIDPRSGQSIATGIKVTSDMEKLQFQADSAMNRVEAAQEGANTRNQATIEGANTRNQATIEGANTRNQAAIEGANTRAANRPATSYSPTTIKADRARNVINRNPSIAQFIQPDGTVLAADSVGRVGAAFGRTSSFTEADRNKIVDYIEGKTTEIPILTKPNDNGVSFGSPVQPQVMRQRNRTTGQTRVSTDGGKTWRIE
jgi:hypothetical protein